MNSMSNKKNIDKLNIDFQTDQQDVSTFFSGGTIKNKKVFQALIENSSDITTVIDKEGRILYASPSNKRLTGYDFEELNGVVVFELIHPLDVQLVRDIYLKYLIHLEELKPLNSGFALNLVTMYTLKQLLIIFFMTRSFNSLSSIPGI